MYNGLPLDKMYAGMPLANKNAYWSDIGSLVCVLSYHWSFKLYDIIFYRHFKQLHTIVDKFGIE